MLLNKTKDQFATQVQCARDAGVYDNMFLAFGSLLGYVRDGSIAPGDDDMDVGFLSDNITKEQHKKYFELLKERGCFEYRSESAKTPYGKYYWISIRKHPVATCFKCCNWFFFESLGYMWHHKGNLSLIKGMPVDYIKIGEEIEFLGTKIHLPAMPGSCLDWWYPDWMTRRSCCSSVKLELKNYNPFNNTGKIHFGEIL